MELGWQLEMMLKSMYLKMRTKAAYRNPWTVKTDQVVKYEIFMEIYKCFRDWRPSIGFRIEVEKYKGTNPVYPIKTVKIVFTELKVVLSLFWKLVGAGSKITHTEFLRTVFINHLMMGLFPVK